MSATFVRNVLREHAQSIRPGELDLWPAIYSELSWAQRVQHHRSWPQVRLPRLRLTPIQYKGLWKASVLAGVLALLVVGALSAYVLTFNPPPSVSAAEILAHADQAADSTSLPDIQSFHGIHAFSYRNSVDQPFTEIRSETWFQAPGSYLYREVTRTADGHETSWYNGTDGMTFYQYVSVLNQLQLRDLDTLPARDPSTDTLRIRLFNPTNLDSLLDAVRRKTPLPQNERSEPRPPYVYEVKLLGSESVLGREAYILDLTFVPGSALQSPELQLQVPAHIKMWVEQQLYAVLRFEAFDEQGRLVQRGTYSSFQINGTIDPSAFSFLAGSDAEIVDMRTVTAGEVDQAWQASAERAPFVLFAPTDLPQRVTARAPIYNAFQSTVSQVYLRDTSVVVLPSYDATEGTVTTGKAGSVTDYNPQVRTATTQWLVLTEGSPSAISESDLGEARPVQIGGGIIARLYDRPEGKILVVDRSDTRIMLRVPASIAKVDSQTESQMIRFAESMQPLSKK